MAATTTLRTQVLALLHALLEGNDALMVERMRTLLDLSTLDEVAHDWCATSPTHLLAEIVCS